MIDLDKLIAEARSRANLCSQDAREAMRDTGDIVTRLADALEYVRAERDAALARVEELEDSRDGTTIVKLADAEARIAEAAKLHRNGGTSQGYTEDGYGYIENCCETCGSFGEYGEEWPCETAVALGLTAEQEGGTA